MTPEQMAELAARLRDAAPGYLGQFFHDLRDAADLLDSMAQRSKPVAWRAWFDADNGARWLFTLWPDKERLDVEWEPLYRSPIIEQAHGIRSEK